MKELIFDQTGRPQEVLYLKESEMPQAKPHEVLIRVTARNINPSDIMFVRGMYGITPKLPSSAGFEACGVVEKSDETGKVPVGTRVMFTAIGTWKEYVCIPAALVIPVPAQMPDSVACQAFVNPMTAYGMIEDAGLEAGQWLLLTAGASAFGKFAIQMAKAKGIRVAATVRHESQKELLLDLGAELVINTTTEKLAKVIFEKTEVGVDVVFDAVGGELGVKALSCLKQKGRMMVFGALA
jgi:NADPH:quinone reductase-like Zn-dependent oxidoreductase